MNPLRRIGRPSPVDRVETPRSPVVELRQLLAERFSSPPDRPTGCSQQGFLHWTR
jgi:hypothetical protein